MPSPTVPRRYDASPSLTVPLARVAVAVSIAAVTYNGVLAFLFAHGIPVTTSLVAATEVLILCVATALIFATGFSQRDIWPALFGYLGVAIGVAMSLTNARIFADGARIFAIVALFTMLGMRLEMRWVDRCFAILTWIILAVLVIELVSTTLYVSLFKPAAYYEATRGVAKFFLNKSGLFRNSLGFEGRLSLNPFSNFRTSSIFIEQVSLANYAGVLIVYLVTRWRHIAFRTKTAHAITLALILVTNSTRTSMTLALVALLGYWIYPKLPRLGTLLVAPLMLGIGLLVLLVRGASAGDDLAGRLTKTVVALGSLGIDSLLGAGIDLLGTYGDSGYPYLISATTVFGAIAFWLYASLMVPRESVDGRRCAWAAAIYLFANMLVGGNAVFSIKVAAPLWLLVGCLYGEKRSDVTRRIDVSR